MDLREGMALVEERGQARIRGSGRAPWVAPHVPEAGEFWEGLAVVKKGSPWGFIDKTGQTKIETRFDGGESFDDGLARVEIKGKSDFIDIPGESPSTPVSTKTSSKGSRPFGNQERRQVWLYRQDRSTEGACPILVGLRVQEGVARVREDDAKWVLIDGEGNRMGEGRFDTISEFHEGFARVRIDREYGFVDPKGVLVCPSALPGPCTSPKGSRQYMWVEATNGS